MLENAIRLCGAKFGTLFLYEKGLVQIRALAGVSEAADRDFRSNAAKPPIPGSTVDRMLHTKQPLHVDDLQADKAMAKSPVMRAGGRSYIGVPLLKDGEVIGALGIYRIEVRPFTSNELALVVNFATQAVIAIENTRLLSELRRRTDDLSDALEQRTATGDVLDVINRSAFQLQPVLDAIVQTASRLCQAEYAVVFRLQDGLYHPAAANNAKTAFVKYLLEHPIAPGADASRPGRHRTQSGAPGGLSRRSQYTARGYQRVGKHRSMLGVPLLRDGVPIGVIGLMRNVVKPFTDKQIELVQNFAAQAVIAIQNARLLGELREILAAANCYCRCAQGYQPVNIRSAGCAQYSFRIGSAALRCRTCVAVSPGRRDVSMGGRLRSFAREPRADRNTHAHAAAFARWRLGGWTSSA